MWTYHMKNSLRKNPVVNSGGYQKRLNEVDEKLKNLYILRKNLISIEETVKENVLPSDISRYRQLEKIISEADGVDDAWEEASDELEELEKKLPMAWIENEKALHRCNANINILKKEKNILVRVVKTEGGEAVYKQPDISIIPGRK